MSENINGGHIDAETQEMLRSFVSEAFDSLDTNEPIVEDLRNEGNSESVNAIFRVFHTLKGLSGFFEMYVINKVTHQAETLLDLIRKQNLPQSEETLTIVYQVFDFLRDLLQRVSTDYTDVSAEEEAEDMILIIKDAIEQVKGEHSEDSPIVPQATITDKMMENDVLGAEDFIDETAEAQEPSEGDIDDIFGDDIPDNTAAGGEEPETEDIAYESLVSGDMLDQYMTNSNELVDTIEKNLLELESNPQNETLVRETFGATHSLKGNSGFMGFKEIEEISMDMETIMDAVRDKSLDIDQTIVTVLLSNIETIRDRLQKIEKDAEDAAGKEKSDNKDFEIDLDAEPTKTEQPKAKPKEEKKAEKPVKDKPKAKETKKAESPTAKKPSKSSGPAKPTALPAMQRKDIRVETSKIDKLFDLVGELITIESMVTKNPDLKGLELPNFQKSSNMLNKITRELQEISMSIRMMPLEGLFNKMKRLVRDVSLKMNKKINFSVSGQETEMDKNVIDEISDPLVHILRNAIDHGVETPEERLESGKEEFGTVSLSARYEGNEILIIVEDDGAGINREAILKKAEEKGILKMPPENYTDKEIYALIFEAGFSTAKQLTDISGRGVGMDVVRKNIEKLRGSIDVDSKYGYGSKITLRIPLTLAIMEAMLIRIGESTFALPILVISESFRPLKAHITLTMDGLEVARVRDEVLPIVRVHELFGLEPDSRNLQDGILLIIEARDAKVCLFVDEIVGQQQAVIKSLSDYIGKVPGLTGCMVLGDGTIGLILDIESLIALAQQDVAALTN